MQNVRRLWPALMLLGAVVSSGAAQHGDKPRKQEEKRSEGRGRGEQRQDRQQPQQQAQPRAARQQPVRSQQQAQVWVQSRGWQRGGGGPGSATWQRNQARNWEREHRTWPQRGGYGGYYIPNNRFSVSFGAGHFFRIRNRPVIYMGYPRFEYGGFSFLMVDPWPEYWQENWYDRDDVYIDYDEGYYLYNRGHPGTRLAISLVF